MVGFWCWRLRPKTCHLSLLFPLRWCPDEFGKMDIQILLLSTASYSGLCLRCVSQLIAICTEYTRVPWTARKSNQSILKEIYPEHSLEGLLMKLKPQHFGHLMHRVDCLEKTLMLGKIEGRRTRGRQRSSWSDGIWAHSGRGWRTGKPGVLQSMESQRVGHDWVTEQQPPISLSLLHIGQ